MSILNEIQNQIYDREGDKTGLPCISLLQCGYPNVQYATIYEDENGFPKRYIEVKGIL